MMSFEDSLKFRHACKIFDDKRKISDENFFKIIEAGRLSPSSVGLEPWDFLLVENSDLKERLKKECWDQLQITTASHLLVVFAKISDLRPGSEYIKDMVSRRADKNSAQHSSYIEKIESFILNNVGLSDLEIFAWSKAQTFLAVQNMMSMAAVLGIDSCPMEGWSSEKNLDNILTNDPQKRRIAVILSFGYRLNEQKPKIRRNLDEILKVIY